jgi:hypothetical protein
MQLTKIAGDCSTSDCPAIYTTRRNTLAIQGDLLEIHTPAGEGIVEIPLSIFQEAARALGG